MMHLITGGSGSGKSAYAEQQVMEAGEKKTDLCGDDDAVWRRGQDARKTPPGDAKRKAV